MDGGWLGILTGAGLHGPEIGREFEISVEMPGEIIGSNADSVVGGTATWNFRAGDLGYGDVELMVSSVIATEPAR